MKTCYTNNPYQVLIYIVNSLKSSYAGGREADTKRILYHNIRGGETDI